MSLKRTSLYDQHLVNGAKLVDFSGWELPIHYGSQIEEHIKVRTDVGMFDVSHMLPIDVQGDGARAFLRHLLSNDIAKLKETGRALYSCMLNEDGMIMDDLLVYFLNNKLYRLVVNAATAAKDVHWVKQQALNFDVEVCPRTDLSMIAVQGPNAVSKVAKVLELEDLDQLPNFSCMEPSEDWLIARTGYTGEDGVEISMPHKDAPHLWEQLVNYGIAPVGLGARDSLRLEAGLNLYGSDMDETVTPYSSNVGWTVTMKSERDFIGKDKLLEDKQNDRVLIGVILEDKGIIRRGYKVLSNDGNEIGEITSGGFSPTLDGSIGFARVSKNSLATELQIEIRKKLLKARVVKLPFVKNGKKNF